MNTCCIEGCSGGPDFRVKLRITREVDGLGVDAIVDAQLCRVHRDSMVDHDMTSYTVGLA